MRIFKPEWVGHDGTPVFSVALSPDGARFATGGGDQKVKVSARGRRRRACVGSSENATVPLPPVCLCRATRATRMDAGCPLACTRGLRRLDCKRSALGGAKGPRAAQNAACGAASVGARAFAGGQARSLKPASRANSASCTHGAVCIWVRSMRMWRGGGGGAAEHAQRGAPRSSPHLRNIFLLLCSRQARRRLTARGGHLRLRWPASAATRWHGVKRTLRLPADHDADLVAGMLFPTSWCALSNPLVAVVVTRARARCAHRGLLSQWIAPAAAVRA